MLPLELRPHSKQNKDPSDTGLTERLRPERSPIEGEERREEHFDAAPSGPEPSYWPALQSLGCKNPGWREGWRLPNRSLPTPTIVQACIFHSHQAHPRRLPPPYNIHHFQTTCHGHPDCPQHFYNPSHMHILTAPFHHLPGQAPRTGNAAEPASCPTVLSPVLGFSSGASLPLLSSLGIGV